MIPHLRLAIVPSALVLMLGLVDTPATHVRRVPLEGAQNFRDLGGYETQDGHHVKWGLVYRSNHLADLTAADYEKLNALGIKVICDLRTDGERKRFPTVWQGGTAPETLHAPVMRDEDINLSPDRLKAMASAGNNALTDTYGGMVTKHPEEYGRVLRRIAYGPLPSVTHCTAGKDRTGVFSALLLTLLGVPRDTIVKDYKLTSEYMGTEANLRRARADWQRLTGSSEPPPADVIQRLSATHEEALNGAFDTITRVYGSFDAFVRDGLKLAPADVEALRARLLE